MTTTFWSMRPNLTTCKAWEILSANKRSPPCCKFMRNIFEFRPVYCVTTYNAGPQRRGAEISASTPFLAKHYILPMYRGANFFTFFIGRIFIQLLTLFGVYSVQAKKRSYFSSRKVVKSLYKKLHHYWHLLKITRRTSHSSTKTLSAISIW